MFPTVAWREISLNAILGTDGHEGNIFRAVARTRA